MSVAKRVLPHTSDHYKGIIVKGELPDDPPTFHSILIGMNALIGELLLILNYFLESLSKWSTEGRRGIWLHLPISQSHLIALAVRVAL